MCFSLLTGVSSGAASVAVPVYVGETASASVRGALGTAMQLAISFGILYVDCLGLLGSWRWMSFACLAVAPVWVLMLLVVPESPAHLLAQRKFDEARLALQFLRGHSYVEAELANIQTAVDESLNHNVATADFIKKPEYCRSGEKRYAIPINSIYRVLSAGPC